MIIGYDCINTELKSKGIFKNRKIRRKWFDTNDIEKVSTLSLNNEKN